jgi:hypothetical protein
MGTKYVVVNTDEAMGETDEVIYGVTKVKIGCSGELFISTYGADFPYFGYSKGAWVSFKIYDEYCINPPFPWMDGSPIYGMEAKKAFEEENRQPEAPYGSIEAGD